MMQLEISANTVSLQSTYLAQKNSMILKIFASPFHIPTNCKGKTVFFLLFPLSIIIAALITY